MTENETLTVEEVLDIDAGTTETVEVVAEPDARLLMDTPLDEYTVTEGLLLLIFMFVLLNFFLNLVRR